MAICLDELLDVGAAERPKPEMATVSHGTAWTQERPLPAVDHLFAIALSR